MQSLVRNMIMGLGSLCGTVAAAQVSDSDTGPVQPKARASIPAVPTYAVHNSGPSKAILVPFGPFITQTGVGGGGADVSELYTTFTLGGVGYKQYGYLMDGFFDYHVADDFVVGQAEVWSVSDIKWLSYQIGAPTTGSLTALYLNLWSTNPQGQLPGAQWKTGGNQLQSLAWSGVYRVADSDLGLSNRAILEVSCGAAWIPFLGTGNYWLEAWGVAPGTFGPYAVPKTRAGQVPPTGDPWNGLQSVSGGWFAQAYDTGLPNGSIHEPADFVWQIEGSVVTSSMCPSKTSSLGCTPLLMANVVTASKSGAPAATLTAAPVPGGAGLPGIIIYAKTPPAGPFATSFGLLCLSGFQRAGAFPSVPGGTSGTCTGAYEWNVSAIAAGTPSVAIGDVLRIQAWYRDPGFPPPGNANLTNVFDGITIVP
jgi:hypothetical protein